MRTVRGVRRGRRRRARAHVARQGYPSDDTAGFSVQKVTITNPIAVLSDNTDMNDDEQYGISTIEDVARLVQRDLNNAKLTGSSTASARLAVAANASQPQAQLSSAVVPALPTPARG
jgi:hypothetical protein